VRKYNKGVVTSADFAPWIRPKPQSGLIIGERWIPLEDLPAAPVSLEDQGEAGGCGPEASLPQVPAASSRVRHARGYSSGVVTNADCGSPEIRRVRESVKLVLTGADFGPRMPRKPQGGLIVEGRWIDRPHSPDTSTTPADDGAAVGAIPKRRARKR